MSTLRSEGTRADDRVPALQSTISAPEVLGNSGMIPLAPLLNTTSGGAASGALLTERRAQAMSPTSRRVSMHSGAAGGEGPFGYPASGGSSNPTRSTQGHRFSQRVETTLMSGGAQRGFLTAASQANAGGASSHRHSIAMRKRHSHVVAAATAAGTSGGSAGGGGVPSGSHANSVQLEGDDGGIEMREAHRHLSSAIELRAPYKEIDKGQSEGAERLQHPVALHVEDGIVFFTDERTAVIPWEKYYDDVQELSACAQQPHCQSACRYRLQVLEERFNLYKLCNGELEEGADRYRRGGGVFANSWKVDNYVVLANIMNGQTLVEYIQDAVETRGDEPVVEVVDAVGNRVPQTLARACELLDWAEPYLLTPEGLGLEISSEKPLLDFNVLNPELNRGGRNSAELLRMFLTKDTLNNGDHFAEVVKPTFQKNEARTRCPQATEAAFEITGMITDEWEGTAEWLRSHHLDRFHTNRWCVSLPRQKMRSGLDSSQADVLTFEDHQQHLDHLFLPLFHATLAPEDPKNSDVAALLTSVGSFLVVFSPQGEHESVFQRKRRRPADVPWSERVSDLYFTYYIWANITSLNALRRRRGLNTFQLRAVAGGLQHGNIAELDSMVLSYLLCDSIVNGVALEDQPVLQFLYGVQGIGVVMSPMANNSVGGVPYMENPFQVLFRRGLRVSLATTSPLLFHHSTDALTEEYGTARRVFRLSGVDMCEAALNSVLTSAFEDEVKGMWLGESFMRDGLQGNVCELSSVPTARLELRRSMWACELQALKEAGSTNPTDPDANVASSATTVHQSTTRVSSSVVVLKEGPSSPTAMRVTLSMPMPTGAARARAAPYIVVDPRVEFPRVHLMGLYDRDMQYAAVAQLLHRALELRHTYMRQLRRATDRDGGGADMFQLMQNPLHQIELAFRRDKDSGFHEDEWMFKTVEGVVVPHEVHQIPRLPQDMYHYEDFRAHVQELRNTVESIHVRNFATRRLQLLEHKFKMHVAVNHSREAGSTATKSSQNRDFYQSTKVDNTVRMESGMTARQLLDFIVAKAQNSGDDIVSHQKGREPQTLRQLLNELHISADSLTVDDLDVQVDTALASASQQYTPEGRDELLTLLLKTDNQMNGRYFAELTKLTFDNLKRDNFTFSENRLPIYGASKEEWALLSTWFDTHGMASSHNRWMVQIPRIYGYLRRKEKVQNFAEYLENIFKPLWSVSLHPSKEPRLFHFVNHITGFDCVENEDRPDISLGMATKPPHEWTSEDDPPYNYYLYHIWANIYSLNEFRRRRQFTSFTFRPSCGERGQLDHLIGGFLLANSVSYGVRLGEDAPLQYLFYLAQIGVTVCPLSNNTKVLNYLGNPFPGFFRRGLMVSLGTDGPLMYHHTQEPLIEEYSIASKVWKLSPNDMCEVARNSVLLSGFSPAFKRDRLGNLFFLSSSASNDALRTHLSDIRVAYRFEAYHSEVGFLEHISGLEFQKAMLTLPEEQQRMREFNESARRRQLRKGPVEGAIIESTPDEADLQRLTLQRTTMHKQLENLEATLGALQKQNKQLTEKLAEERDRDRQAAQMRRGHIEGRLDELGAIHKLLISTQQQSQPHGQHRSSGDSGGDLLATLVRPVSPPAHPGTGGNEETVAEVCTGSTSSTSTSTGRRPEEVWGSSMASKTVFGRHQPPPPPQQQQRRQADTHGAGGGSAAASTSDSPIVASRGSLISHITPQQQPAALLTNSESLWRRTPRSESAGVGLSLPSLNTGGNHRPAIAPPARIVSANEALRRQGQQ